MEETLSRADMGLLVASVDAVLSLHRAEGFGLLLAEAMLRGVPVVATGWSGNLDFMTNQDSGLIGYRLIPARDPQGTYDMPKALWADADVEEAAGWLRRLRDEPNFRADLARRGRDAASAKLSLDAFHRAVAGSLPPPDGAAGTFDRPTETDRNDNHNGMTP
jgi:glycosyltransferase involved in cell wall biosynthesis